MRADRPQLRLPAWAVTEGPFGVRLFDVGIVALVIAAIEINVITGSGPGAVPLDLRAYLLGALLAVPILFRHRWPFQVGRVIAEERLRIARELHDTVAHTMATITVQAGLARLEALRAARHRRASRR